jgi:Flp pilus assembly protein TadG
MRTWPMTKLIDLKKGRNPMFRDPGEDIGQALIELALVLPIFILLLVGAVEVGYLAYASIEVASAARAGVAYAAQNHTTAADITNITLAAKNDVSQDLKNLSVTVSQSCTCSDGTSITCATATACLSPAITNVTVQVQTSAPVNTIFNFPGIPSSVTLGGYASMSTEE